MERRKSTPSGKNKNVAVVLTKGTVEMLTPLETVGKFDNEPFKKSERMVLVQRGWAGGNLHGSSLD